MASVSEGTFHPLTSYAVWQGKLYRLVVLILNLYHSSIPHIPWLETLSTSARLYSIHTSRYALTPEV